MPEGVINMSYRIGFASISNLVIDQHFGSARSWQIYDIDNEARFVETRKSIFRCGGNCEGGFNHLHEILKDCDAVFVLKIGETAAMYMISKGIRVFEARGEIKDIIGWVLDGNIGKSTER